MVNCAFDFGPATQVYMALTARRRALEQTVANNDADDEVLRDLSATIAAFDSFVAASRAALAAENYSAHPLLDLLS